MRENSSPIRQQGGDGDPRRGMLLAMTDSTQPPDPQLDQALPLAKVLDDGQRWASSAYQTLKCPKCRSTSIHFGDLVTRKGNDNYDAQGGGWQGRGDLNAIRMTCEDGHAFDICIGFHKGSSAIFARIAEDE